MTQITLKVLHIEDDDGDAKQVKRDCAREFGTENFELKRVDSIKNALLLLAESSFDAILLDLNLGEGQGLENLTAIKEQYPDIAIVILSGHDHTKTALDAVRSGAQEYIVKSYSNSRILGLAVLSSIERKTYERHLFQLANHDELTGLHNRRAFNEYLKQWLVRAGRWERTECLMFIDVNEFKQVNDAMGHDIGDLLLKRISVTIQAGLRASDMLARYGGDEFVVHLDAQSHESKDVSAQVATKISELFSEPFSIGGYEIKAGISIGIAFYPEHGKDVTSLIQSADKAMYQAKKENLPFVFYNSASTS